MICPTKQQYIDMAVLKAGAMFHLGFQAMTCVAGEMPLQLEQHSDELREMLEQSGVYLQIANDLDNLTSEMLYDNMRGEQTIYE